jgi:GntR family transcriptional repressor for pyruvate dehydrogenase complex
VIREAVQELSTEEIGELEAIMNAWQERVNSGQDHVDLDKQFHLILYGSVNNTTLIKLFEVFWTAFEELRLKTIIEGSPEITIRQHLGVLEAVKLRDPELAAQRLIEHFDYVTVHAERAVATQEVRV